MPEKELILPPVDKYPELFGPIPPYLDEEKHYPNGSVDDWRGKIDPEHRITIDEGFEALVLISSLDPPIFCTNDYAAKLDNSGYERALSGTTFSQYIRESVAERLSDVQRQLPTNYRLIVYDGWRSLETQLDAYQMCFDSIVDILVQSGTLSTRNISPEIREIISSETQKYISLPSPMPPHTHPTPEEVEEASTIPSPHNTGGSIDVAIVYFDDESLIELRRLEELLSGQKDFIKRASLNFELAALYRKHAKLPDFGTDFDFAGQESALTHFEDAPDSSQPKQWRRMLYNLMTSVGFEPYSEEWWHFNFGNQMAERTKWLRTGEKGVAKYGGTELSREQKIVEKFHDIVFNELIRANETVDKSNFRVHKALAKVGVTAAQFLEISERVGDPRETSGNLGNPHTMHYRGKLPDEFIQSIKDQLERETA